MSVRIPAVAAAALFASLIATSSASAAHANIDPVYDSGQSVYATATISLKPSDDCTVSYRAGVFSQPTRYSPITADSVVWMGRTVVINPCVKGHGIVWEDGSVSTRIGGAMVSSRYLYPRGRYVVGVTVCSRLIGTARFGCHTTTRAFWARPR
jgi:hypothetical protein